MSTTIHLDNYGDVRPGTPIDASRVSVAQPIAMYCAPEWTITIAGRVIRAGSDHMDWLRSGSVHVIDEGILGWGGFSVIIDVEHDDGSRQHYLACI